MRVSFIWRLAFALTLGFSLGVFVTSKVFIKNMPPTTAIEIGRVKIKGKGNTVENLMQVEDVSTDASETKNKKNRIKRRDRE